jgi:cytochrome b6-f complex iron-sulfur subunit
MSATVSEPTSRPNPRPQGPNRRGLLRGIFAALLGVGLTAWGAAAGLWTWAAARFLVPNLVKGPQRRFKAGLLRDCPRGHVETKYRETFGVWLVHGSYRGQSQVYALQAACTHLGCMTLWDEQTQKFHCPCHGSTFGKDGVNLGGPAARPLPRLAIRIAEDGQLEVDCSRTFQEPRGQWNDPSSFVVPETAERRS